MASEAAVRYHRVYVWEFPVRLYHWANAACILVLAATGYLIGTPVALSSSNEAYQQYLMGWVRGAHFVAAYVFFFNFLVRLWWGFVGNRYARWRSFVPVTLARWREIGEAAKIYLLEAGTRGTDKVGHNALAGFTYFLSFLASLFQVATGFALYADNSGSFIPRLFRWVVPLMGGDLAVRQWHTWGCGSSSSSP